jgi:hypothetical protein
MKTQKKNIFVILGIPEKICETQTKTRFCSFFPTIFDKTDKKLKICEKPNKKKESSFQGQYHSWLPMLARE